MKLLLANVAMLHWVRPHWLWALALLPMLAMAWQVRQRRRSAWRDAVDPHLLAHLLDRPQSHAPAWPWFAMLAATLGIVALAGPSWHRAPQRQWQQTSPLVIALDLSAATSAIDVPPSRLLQARAKIAQLLQRRSGGQVGLVVFADDAYTVAPLTDDVQNIAVFLDALAPDIMPVDGSRADRAVAWSARLLHQAGFRRGDILLLTDHADDPAQAAAASAARDGYRVSVIGIGTTTGATIVDAAGQSQHAQLDDASLQRLASAGDGAYALLTANDSDLRELGLLDAHATAAMASRGPQPLTWADDGFWLLPPVLLLGLLAFRRGRPLALVLLGLSLPWQPAQAAMRDWWLRPDQQTHQRIEQGIRAYRNGNYAAAQARWRDVRDPDAAYDLGNALARQGNYEQAIAAYDEALKLRPGMDDAMANKQAVEAALRRRPLPASGAQQNNQRKDGKQGTQARNGQQQTDPAEQQSGRQRGQQQDAQQQPAQQQPAQAQAQGARQSRPSSPNPQGASPPGTRLAAQPISAADAARQRAADAAQRQRMQQALQLSHMRRGHDDAHATQRVETRAERERRLSDQAWLQRVPDDPGGLLRAKFQLEHERRQQGGG